MKSRSKIACADNVVGMLAEYAKRLPSRGSRHRHSYYRDLAEFTGCNLDTVGTWVNGTSMPLGLPLVKLRFFLLMIGFEPLELAHLRQDYPLGYALAETLTFVPEIPIEKITKELGYEDRNAVLRIAHRGGTADAAHESELREFCDKFLPEVALRRAYWESRLRETAPRAVSFEPESETRYAAPKPPAISPLDGSLTGLLDQEKALRTLAHLVFATEPLARAFAYHGSANDRRRLRAMTATTVEGGNSNVVFELNTLLQMLCGEEARKAILTATRVQNSPQKEDE